MEAAAVSHGKCHYTNMTSLWDVSAGITSPREDCPLRAYPTRMSYLFYYTEQNTKHKRGKLQTEILDRYSLSSTGMSLGKLRGCSRVLACPNHLAHTLLLCVV